MINSFEDVPFPWSFEMAKQETPPQRRSAIIYAVDSTRICEIKGAAAAEVAELIVSAVNQKAADDYEHGH
jgi:hypothetical protein